MTTNCEYVEGKYCMGIGIKGALCPCEDTENRKYSQHSNCVTRAILRRQRKSAPSLEIVAK